MEEEPAEEVDAEVGVVTGRAGTPDRSNGRRGGSA
jgi:hypothetical protein